MAKVVLRRPFLGPDGRVYRRTDNAGRVLVHNFPDEWAIPSTAKSMEQAVSELVEPVKAPEPETLDEIARKTHGKK